MNKTEFLYDAKLTVQGSIYDFQLDLEGAYTIEDALEQLQNHFDTAVHDGTIVLQDPEDIDYIDITEDMVEFDFRELPSFIEHDWDKISEFAEHYYASHYDIDVFEAAHDCGIPFSDIDEAYNGEYDSDEQFAEELVENIGYISDDFPSWIYIDWERTAQSVMYDYEESNGHYFRNL